MKPTCWSTRRRFTRKATQWIAEDSCPAYLIKAEEYLNSERDRVRQYLHQSTESKLISKVEQQLLEQQTELLEKENSGCAALLIDDKKDDLARMFRLFSAVPKGLVPIASIFKSHVQKEGMSLVTPTEQARLAMKKKGEKPSATTSVEQMFTRNAIDLYDKYNSYVKDCFGASALFNRALKEALNTFATRASPATSTGATSHDFSDKLLKKGGSEKLSDEKMEETLEKIVKILTFISDKDLFGTFYGKKLSRRLLQDTSASQDHERSILSKLKTQCGQQFTSKMEGMLNDIQSTSQTQSRFKAWIEEDSSRQPPVDLNVTILTHGFWPQAAGPEHELCDEFARCVEIFQNFYDNTQNTRKLSWMHQLGSATIVVKYASKPIEMVMQTFQVTVLLLFRTVKELTLRQVVEKTKLPVDDAKRVLYPYRAPSTKF